MLAEQLLSAGYVGTKVGLEDLARKYPPHYVTYKITRDKFINFKEGDKFTREMLYYAARDVYELFPVYEGQLPELKKFHLNTAAHDEFSCIPVTADMELTGITLDEQLLLLTKSFYQERQDEIEKGAIKAYNKEIQEKGLRKKKGQQLTVMPEEDIEDHFDIDSSQAKLNALRALGYGVENVRRETLENLDTGLTKLLAEYSFCRKMTTTYGQRLLDKRSPWTGKFHPEFHQMGRGEDVKGDQGTTTTATGRFTSDAQQMPTPTKTYALVKNQEELTQVETVLAEQLKQGMGVCCTAKGEPVFLGNIGRKEYHLFPADDKQPKPYVAWRVPNIREAIRARPGYKILTADYSQIEVRIMAEL